MENIPPFLKIVVGTTLQVEEEEGEGPKLQPPVMAEHHIQHFSSVCLQEQARQARALGGSLRVGWGGNNKNGPSWQQAHPGQLTQVIGNRRR